MLRTGRIFVVFCLLVGGLIAQAMTPELKTKVLADVSRVINEKAFVPGLDLAAWSRHVEKHQTELDAADNVDAYTKALNRTCREFGVSHLSVRTPTQEKRRTTRQSAGFGIRVTDGEHVLQVVEVNPNGPSVGKGLDPGDEIILVDGKVPEEIEDLQGEVGSKSVLKVRKSDGVVVELELERKTFSLDRPDTLTWVDDESVVLRIHTFMQGYKRDAITKFCEEAARAKYVLVDLRGNGGGQISNLRHLLGHFLPTETPVGAFIGKNSVNNFREAGMGDGKDPIAVAKWSPRKFKTDPQVTSVIRGRVGVLIDRGSASASEITSAALRELLDAPLIGARTAGAVLASTYEKIEGGFSVQYPASDYVTTRGIRLEKNPLKPDVEIAAESRPASRGTASRPRVVTPQRPADDVAVKKAFALLRTREPRPAATASDSRPARENTGANPRGEGETAPASRPRRQRGTPTSRPTSRPGRGRGND